MSEEIDPEEKEYDDKMNIIRANKKFAKAMLTRMLAKYDEGLRGWDNPDNRSEISFRIEQDVWKNTTAKAVDIANRAMMLYMFDTEKPKD
ncbi:MAG: hypothetical protein WCY05_01950 [Candidatus Omnitrophota bacterium]